MVTFPLDCGSGGAAPFGTLPLLARNKNTAYGYFSPSTPLLIPPFMIMFALLLPFMFVVALVVVVVVVVVVIVFGEMDEFEDEDNEFELSEIEEEETKLVLTFVSRSINV
jgi:hypothetical protein